MEQKCPKCRKLLPQSDFYVSRKIKSGIQSYCKKCTNFLAYQRKKENTKKLQTLITEMKRSPCSDCGAIFPPICMDYDHHEGGKINGRKSEVSNYAKQGRINKAKEEISRCDLVCSNCHRIRTAKRSGWLHLL